MLDVRLIQLAHTNQRNTGVQPPQQITAFNVYAEEQAILNPNQALVQQIISSGLASPGDTLAILGILLASGQVSSSIFRTESRCSAADSPFGRFAADLRPINLNLNSSDSRELDHIQLRLGDGEEGTIKSGIALSDRDLAVFKPRHIGNQHSGTDDGGNFGKPVFPALAAQFRGADRFRRCSTRTSG